MSALPSNLRDVRRLKRVDDAVNKLLEIQQRMKNNLSLVGHPPLEIYLKGHFSIVLDVQISRVRDANVGTLYVTFSDNPNGVSVEHRASIVISAHAYESGCTYRWDQKPVLVQDVQFVKSAEGVILSRIWFYDVQDEVGDFFGGLPYRAAVKGGNKLLPGTAEGEFGVLAVLPGAIENNRADGNIEGTSQVVDDITGAESKIVWHGFSQLELKAILTRLRVFFQTEIIEITVEERPDVTVKLLNVFFGPLNL